MKLIELKPTELVIQTKTGTLSFDHVLVLPGINHQLSQEQVEKLLVHPDFSRFIGRGINVIEADPQSDPELVRPDANSEIVSLAAFPVTKTDDIIEGTRAIAILERWLLSEQRATVRRQLSARITAIKGGRE